MYRHSKNEIFVLGGIAAGTLIHLPADSAVMVQDIAANSRVITNPDLDTAKVTSIHKSSAASLLCIKARYLEPVFVTANQPFLTGHGWMPASRLNADDFILSAAGERLPIESIHHIRQESKIYSIALDTSLNLLAGGYCLGDQKLLSYLHVKDVLPVQNAAVL